jgi:hypothetical protein
VLTVGAVCVWGAVGALCAWQLWEGVAHRRVWGRWRYLRRDVSPAGYWVFIVVYLFFLMLASANDVALIAAMSGHLISN